MSTDELIAVFNDPAEMSEWSELDWYRVYQAAQRRAALPGFGTISGLRPTDVDVPELERRTGLSLEALTPRDSGVQWLLLGMAFFSVELLLARTLGLESSLVRTLPSIVAVFGFDQLVLGSRLTLGLVLALRPQYGDKLARHEAGHFLLAYLCGLPVTGYYLAGRSMTIGQAGTIFLDLDLSEQLNRGELRQSTLARYTTILMAGIAAEAIAYDRAEGGFADEQQLVSILQSLRPAWEGDRVFSLARWSVAQSVELLREYEEEHVALKEKMRENAPLGECIRVIAQGAARRKIKESAASSAS